MARICHHMGIGHQDGENTFYRIRQKPQEKNEIEKGFLTSLFYAMFVVYLSAALVTRSKLKLIPQLITLGNMATAFPPIDDPVTLHQDHTSIFVNGLGGTAESSRKQARKLSMNIYDSRHSETSRITSILNRGTRPYNVHDKTLSDVLKHLVAPDMLRWGNGEIRLVIFCHSNGVKVVSEALDPGVLTKALQALGLSNSIIGAMNNIRSQVAVVSFGGVSLIPDGYAKLVLNFRATHDFMARICHHLGFGHQDGENTFYRIPEKPQKKKEIEKGLLSSFFCSVNFGSQQTSEKYPSFRLSETSWSENPHYLDEYIDHDGMIDYIQMMLGIRVHQ